MTRNKARKATGSPDPSIPALSSLQTSLQKPREGMVMRSAGPRAGCEQRSENIDKVVYDGWKLQVEHSCTAYPKELIKTRELGDSVLYVCHKCFKYTMDPSELRNHNANDPGREIPRGRLVHTFDAHRYQIYEIDGAVEEHQLFLQRMCLFGKFFIQNKSIWYEFENFLFYTLVENKPGSGKNFSYCGFFSKEKISYDENNLSCIILYPQHRSTGLGLALIEFSYFVSKLAGKLGGPEKPISDLGKRGYSSYWSKAIASSILSMTAQTRQKRSHQGDVNIRIRKNYAKGLKIYKGKSDTPSLRAAGGRGKGVITIDEIANSTGIAIDDVLETLGIMGIAKYDSSSPMISRGKLREWAKI